MNKKLFDYLLNQFEQSYCLSNYIAWKNDQVSGDSDYIERCKIKNQLVQDAFIESGNQGIRYLIAVMNDSNEDERERAITILGEIGDRVQTRFNLQRILSKRLGKEPIRRDISRRIEYSIKELARKAI